MSKITLSTPLSPEELKKLSIGDRVYLNGLLITGRDDVHRRIVLEGMASPVDLQGNALFHAGPIMKQNKTGNPRGDPGGDDSYEVISIGPTTSMRMEQCQEEFLEITGTRFIVGKGGMGEKTARACRRLGAVHTVFPGGCAVLAAGGVEKVEGVKWLDLGMPEAMWILRVRDFGPLIVSIDTRGNNLFENNRRLFHERKEAALEILKKSLVYGRH